MREGGWRRRRGVRYGGGGQTRIRSKKLSPPPTHTHTQVKSMEEGWRLQLGANQSALADEANQRQSLAAQATLSAVQVRGGGGEGGMRAGDGGQSAAEPATLSAVQGSGAISARMTLTLIHTPPSSHFRCGSSCWSCRCSSAPLTPPLHTSFTL